MAVARQSWTDGLATPVFWLIGAAVVQTAAWTSPLALSHDQSFQDTYYVVAHAHYGLNLAGAMVVFAVLYLLLDSFIRAPRRRGLRLAHLGLMLGGDLIILSPSIVLRMIGTSRRYEDAGSMLVFWSWVSTAGYVMTLVGLVVFAVVVVDAIRNRQTTRVG